MGKPEVRQSKYARAVAISVFVVLPTQVLRQPIVCAPPQADPVAGNQTVTLDDEWQVMVEPSGKIYLNDKSVSRSKLKEYAAGWAKEGTWPIVVRGHTGTKYGQIRLIVALFREVGVTRPVSCVAPQL
jgi:biopolymer transport protein ExbD